MASCLSPRDLESVFLALTLYLYLLWLEYFGRTSLWAHQAQVLLVSCSHQKSLKDDIYMLNPFLRVHSCAHVCMYVCVCRIYNGYIS